MDYKYITENNLENRQDYMYSEYGGYAFLEAYAKSRQDFVAEFEQSSNIPEEVVNRPISETETKLREISSETIDLANRFVKSFEVRKKLYETYDWETWKPIPDAAYDNLELYLLLGEKLLEIYKENRILKYLNCILKLDDTMLSLQHQLSQSQRERLKSLLEGEMLETSRLQKRCGLEGGGQLW